MARRYTRGLFCDSLMRKQGMFMLTEVNYSLSKRQLAEA